MSSKMKTIKKISLCAIAAMAVASCNMAELSEQHTSNPVRTEINACSSVSTKLTIDGLQTSWESGDMISVFDTEGMSEGDFTATAAGTNVTFTGYKISESDVLKVAVFPSDEDATYMPSTNKLYTIIPAEQSGKISSSLAVAENDGSGNFMFSNAASVIKITVPESESINFISFTADASTAIAGDVIIDLNETVRSAVSSNVTGAAKYSRIIVYNDGEPLVGDQYITVIPGSYSGTLVFGKTDAADRYAAAKIVAEKNYSVNTIKNFGAAANLNWVKNAVTGVFSMDLAGTKVLMSQGYIKYTKSTGSWRISNDFNTGVTSDSSDEIENFNWFNANNPSSTDGSAVSASGDWALKLPQSGWYTPDHTQLTYLFHVVKSTTPQTSRQVAGFVKQSLGLVNIEDDGKTKPVAVMYPDGWAGEFYPDDDLFKTKVTVEELKALEDKGCAIVVGGDFRNADGKVNNSRRIYVWSSHPNGALTQAVPLRIFDNSGALVRDTKAVDVKFSHRARPCYIIK